jgi:V8-like Glu-specific endopeptidase
METAAERSIPLCYRITSALVVLTAIGLVVFGMRASAAPPTTAAAPSKQTDVVGALFTLDSDGTLGSHFCTATVVDSPTGNVVVTAAHCLRGQRAATLAFVPGFHKGAAPLGVWAVTRIVVDTAWANSADPDHDFAFLVVHRAGVRSSLEALTGGERIGVIDPVGQRATVVGYPAAADTAISCSNSLRRLSSTQLEFDCGGYTNGTSGSALVVNPSPATGLGTVVGVIGGYEEGGRTPSVSYSAAFGASALSLYQVAANAA